MGNIPSVSTGQKATAAQYNALQAGLNGVTENSYTSWSKILDMTITGTSGNAGQYLDIDNAGNVFGMGGGEHYWYVNKTGTFLQSLQQQLWSPASDTAPQLFAKSITGLYAVLFDSSTPEIKIFSDGSLLSTIPLPSTSWTASSTYTIAVAISPNGQYIALLGANAGTTIERLQIWEGQS